MKVLFSTGLKGGIGKSMVSSFTAQALLKQGKQVGILDADIPSPNISDFFDMKSINVNQDHKLETIKLNDGKLQIFSMGGLITNETISMDEHAYADLVRDVVRFGDWNCDVMIVDLPAGSSSTMKAVTAIFANNMIGNIIVVSPAHTKDAERVLRWHQINDVPILGIVENMSYFECEDCKKKYHIFGEADTTALANKYKTKVIARIPLSMDVRTAFNKKKPIHGPIAKSFENIANLIEHAEPKRPGFLKTVVQKGKEKYKDIVIKAFISMLKIANTEVPIADISAQHGYHGGRDIRLNIMDNNLEHTYQTIDLILKNGALRIINGNAQPKVVIGIKMKALAGSLVGYINGSNGDKIPYTLLDAYLNQDCVVYGEQGDSLTSLKFMKETWAQVQAKENGRISKMLKAVV